MQNISCNLCGAKESKFLFQKNGYNIVQCSKCGLAYVNPQPEKEEIKEFYKDHQEFYMERYPRKERSKLRDARREIKRIRRLISPKKIDSSKILDIGCSCGFLLKEVQDLGGDAFGIDISEWEVKYAKKKIGVKADVRAFTVSKLPPESFDVITMFDILEHLLNPFQGLKECFQILKEGGILIVGTPDFGHPKAQREGKNWGHLKPPEHLFYFSLLTLKYLGEKTGFVYKGAFFRVPWKDGIKAIFEKPKH